MKKPSVRGRLRLMASGIRIPDNNPYVEAGLIQAQQDIELLKLLQTTILASSILQNDKKTNELVNKAIKLIYFEDEYTVETSEKETDIFKDFKNMAFKIDVSSIPMEQDKLVRKH